jgi:hypothetical protein
MNNTILSKIQKILNTNSDSINLLGNRPINLTTKLLPSIKSNYVASIKADGLRCFLYYDEYIYSIIHPFIITNIEKNNLKGVYLLDCEYIEKYDEYYIFDILIHENKDVTNYNLKERINLISKDFLTKKIKLKEIYNLNNKDNIFKISKEIYNKKYDFRTDGIIYTPIYESYYNYFIYKWKPLEQQTIDFLIREIKSENSGINELKKYNLFVSSNNNNNKNKLLKNKDYLNLFPFITKKNNYIPTYFSPSPTATIIVKLVKNKGYVYGNHNNILINDNTIVEFYYDTQEIKEEFKWKPYKFRLDKTKGYLENYSKNIYNVSKGPNSWKTAISIFNYIKNPIDNKILFGNKNIDNNYYLDIKKKGLSFNLYKYNNYIKNYLYDKYLKKGDNVLDLAGGRGGDLSKMKNSNYVLHINIVNKLLEEATNRYSKMNTQPNINFLKFNLLGNNINKINKIKKNKNINKFNLITCQFAFHYFCESKKSIDFIVKIINDNLEINGIFMMTGYDGQLIFDLLKNNDSLNYKYKNSIFAKIIKKYDEKIFKNYGQPINVYIEKIEIPQDEYLINFNYLTKQFKKHNISIVEENNFSNNLNNYHKILTDDELKYIKLHKYIIYKKNE